MARNRSALHDVLAQGASNRDITVYCLYVTLWYFLDEQTDSGLEHRLVHINRPIMRLPDVAIHLHRELGQKFEFNKETHLWVQVKIFNSNSF